MSSRNQALNSYLTDSNRKIRKNLINIGIGTEQNNNYFFSSNKNQITQFPNIKIFNKINAFKTNYDRNISNNIDKNINLTDKNKHSFTESDNDIPTITSKFNSKRDNYYFPKFPNSVKKIRNIYYYNYLDEKINSNFVLTSMKKPNLNILNINNISNINNIYNQNDFLKSFITSLTNKNNKKSVITIKNLKNSESDIIALNENEKNNIKELLQKKSIVNLNKKIRPIKTKHKDEFKEFLKEILKEYKSKNLKKIKKKIEINTLLYNNKNKNKTIGSNFKKNRLDNEIYFKNLQNKNTHYINNLKSNILNNEFLNSKLNKNKIRLLTEDFKFKKRNIFNNNYRFKKNRIIINKVEEELLDLEAKIKKNFDKFKKNIDDEPVILV